MRFTTFGDWLILKKCTTWKHWNIHLNVGVFVSFPNWFITLLLFQSKVFLSSLWPRLYTNKHSDIINSIVSTLSGFLTKKLSAKNCGSMINHQTTFNLGFYNSRVFLNNCCSHKLIFFSFSSSAFAKRTGSLSRSGLEVYRFLLLFPR